MAQQLHAVGARRLDRELRREGERGLHRRHVGELAAGGEMQLQDHEIEAGGGLGQGVTRLEMRRHRRQGERLARLAHQLDGRRAAQGDGADQPERDLAQALRRRPGLELLDERPAVALQHRAARPEHPHRTGVVGEDVEAQARPVAGGGGEAERIRQPAQIGDGAQAVEGGRRGADADQIAGAHQRRDRRQRRDRPPAGPQRVGAGGGDGVGERRADGDGVVGFAHPEGAAVGLVVQGHGPEVGGALPGVLADGADRAQRRRAPVEDGDA
jgi:hypothetical protein